MRVKDSILLIAGAVFLALVVKTFVIDVVTIPSHSMEGTLLPGDCVLVNKLVDGGRPRSLLSSGLHLPGLRQIARGEVVVFRFPGLLPEDNEEAGTCFVKRCLGMPGDLVGVENGALTINGTVFPSYTVSSSDRAFGSLSSPALIPRAGDTIVLRASEYAFWSPIVVQEGHTADTSGGSAFVDGVRVSSYRVRDNYFFMAGDNAGHSYDSRAWGLLGSRAVVGKAELVYWSRRTATTEPSGGIRWDRIGHLVR